MRRRRSDRLPPVEPLSRFAWDRVEGGVFDRLDQGDHLAPAAAAGASRAYAWLAAPAAAALLLVGWSWRPQAPAPAVAGVSAASAEVAATIEALTDTHIVTTRAPARTTFSGGALTLAPESEVHVSGSDAQGWLILLDRGEIDCEVKPRQGRPPFVVQAGETRVSVVGTHFSVSRRGAAVGVSVASGVVRVSSGSERTTLGAGQQWPSPLAGIVPTPEAARTTQVNPSAAIGSTRTKTARSADAGRLFAKAARLEPDAPRAAVAIYRRLSKLEGPWAANALYAEARLEHEHGRVERAEALLRRYLERHFGAPNRRDAEVLLEKIRQAR